MLLSELFSRNFQKEKWMTETIKVAGFFEANRQDQEEK